MSDSPTASLPPDPAVLARFQAAREYQKAGALQQAQQAYEDILIQEPAHAGSLHMLGLILAQTGQAQQGVDLLCRALELEPHNAQAYYGLGFAMCKLKQFAAGIECYDTAMSLRPQFAEAACDKGSALIELNRCLEAVESFDLAIGWRLDYADAYVYRGNAFMGLQENERAVRSFETGLALNPGFASGHLNLGNALLALRDYEGALASYDRAIALQPDQAMAHSNRSGVLKHLHRFEEALRSGESAIALAPDFAFGHFNYSLLLLLLGDLRAGFEKYHTRWQTDTFQVIRRKFPQPMWLGQEDLKGQTVLIHTEQGLGDTIQFARYAQVLADRGARVVFEVEPALYDLLRTLPGVDTLVRQRDPLPAFDLYCPLMSVPIGCGTTLETVPCAVPYLRTNPAKVWAWQDRLGPKTRSRVGLVWSGSTTHQADHLRSLELSELLDALPDGFDYVSLQKEIRPADIAAVQASGMAHFGDELLTMDDTAALCACIDLVIAVDTSVAHLAGALGLPVWVLLPHMPDWRWLLDRSDSPWYPSARLYRQQQRSDWSAPLAQVQADLLAGRFGPSLAA
jgi:tetratricopeptide (TPR) repeat protein